jgi:hypothetical protein
MSAMAAGERGRSAGASRRRTTGPPFRQRTLTAAPGQRPSAAVPAQRAATAVPGRRSAPAGPGQRPRTPVLTLVPPRRAATHDPPGTPAPAPRPVAGDRSRQAARQAPPRPARVRTRPRTRLTRRGRIVVSALVMAVMLLVAAVAWIAGATRADAARSGPSASAVYRTLNSVVVQPGQSLWMIAAQAEPGADPRGVIQEIIDLNALGGTSIQPGQHLWVPRG